MKISNLPRIEILKEKKLVGKQLKMNMINNRTFELWKSFMPFKKLIQNQVSTDLISMQIYDKSFDFNKFNPSIEFVKWAALEVSNFEKIPENLETYILKGGLYAVFHYVGSNEFATEIFNYIFNIWIPQSEYNIDQREHFEILGEKYKNNDSNSEEEIWIPIIKKF